MLWIKAVHVIMVISWMAGLLYLYRLFVYHAMETEQVVRERLQVMERRLIRGIATPAGVLSLATGISMLVLNPSYLKMPWMHAKLTFVLGLLVSHVQGMYYRQRLLTEPTAYSHKKFRVLNEVPTLLMIGIVIMVIVRPF
ncbi:MAG: protoporphyrinogen oxidase HemJ [Myxococcales bacterium]|nr:protoporphyrinogen oxidase HemJ [Myxococcales bacterium]